MSAEIVNLRRARKAKTRGQREVAAAENRAVFGRTKTDRKKQAAETERATKALEAHRRDKPTD
jgi:hypothetical protein